MRSIDDLHEALIELDGTESSRTNPRIQLLREIVALLQVGFDPRAEKRKS